MLGRGGVQFSIENARRGAQGPPTEVKIGKSGK